MSISDQHFRELGLPYFGQVFAALDTVLSDHGVPCYLIGAAAKNLQTLRNGIKPIRFTLDIDFAIMVPDHAAYDAIMKALQNNAFHGTQEPYRIIHTATDTIVDLLPFGEIEEKGTVRFSDRDTELVMLGFSEVLALADRLPMDDGRTLRVPPLPGMCLLKLLAYGDRPDRTKDLTDILHIIEQYFDSAVELIASDHADLLEGDAFDRNTCSARVIGRIIGDTIAENRQAIKHVLTTLETQLQDPDTSRIALQWAIAAHRSNLDTFAWLKALHQGIQERTNG